MTCSHERPPHPSHPAPPVHRETSAVVSTRDLTPYRIRIALELDGWHVDYDLKEPGLKGGGPHYLIDATTGAILSKRYEQ